MAPAAHRRPRTGRLRRRVGGVTLAGAVASVSSVAVGAPAAHADDHNVWDRVAECESSGRWDINTGNGFYGGLQFWHPTWTGFGGTEFASYAHKATKLEQITVAQRVLKVQGPGAWPVCSVRAGLTMDNGSAPYPGTEEPAPAPAPAPEPPATSATYTVTATAGANIRSGPSTSYAVVGGAAHGTKLVGEISTNGWLKLADGRGWVSGTIVAAVDGGSAGSGGGGTSDMAPLVIDGSRGPLTVKAIQRWAGVSETGRWDTSTIKALQSTVGTPADGLWGPASQAALQTRIGMTRDGSTYMNYRTVVALQKWLNANVIG